MPPPASRIVDDSWNAAFRGASSARAGRERERARAIRAGAACPLAGVERSAHGGHRRRRERRTECPELRGGAGREARDAQGAPSAASYGVIASIPTRLTASRGAGVGKSGQGKGRRAIFAPRCGMPDPTVLTALILGRPICISCIASKANEPSASALKAAVARVGLVFDLHRDQGRCRACGTTTMVLSIEHPVRTRVSEEQAGRRE
jgi:hypothetical protein